MSKPSLNKAILNKVIWNARPDTNGKLAYDVALIGTSLGNIPHRPKVTEMTVVQQPYGKEVLVHLEDDTFMIILNPNELYYVSGK